ncbi:MAG: proline/glycine betaine ABC transporter permease [Alkalispirochaeta sp.]
MFEFPEAVRLPLGDWVDAFMDLLLQNLAWLFDFIGAVGLQVLLAVEEVLQFIPWFVVIPLVGFLAWRALKSVKAALTMMVMLLVVGSFGYWQLAMNTLSVVIVSVIISIFLGVPIGILMARSDRLEGILKPILDGMQTMPTFVYLIPALMLFGLGRVPATFATIIYAIPPVIRLTNVGIREVASDVVEAAQAFGSSTREILFDVQLPLAKPSIMVGINQTTMMALAMVVIGSMIGNRGLGMEVLLAINRVEIGQGFEAGLSIVFLAIIIDRITSSFAKNDYQESRNAE